MSARAMTMDAAMDTGSTIAAAGPRAAPSSWHGRESPWVLAAWAAAPWPAWLIVAAIGVPGPSHVPAWLHGIFVLGLVFAVMVAWTHRPGGRTLGRWLPAILGTALMGELLAAALTDMGRSAAISEMGGPGRALSVALICVAIYEVGPIVAATSRMTRSEVRHRSLDVIAYGVFAALALGAFAWDPTPRYGESLWRVSPWVAAVVAFPFAAARCAGRDARLPAPRARGGALFGLALLAWALFVGLLVADWDGWARGVHRMRWGVQPLEGLSLALPALSMILAFGAAAVLLARAWSVRHAPRGTVTGVGDGGVTLERDEVEDPIWVALTDEVMPPEGARVTLLGVRRDAPDAGPFRDGAVRWRARRAWVGAPRDLARTLAQRAAGWLVWAAAGALGLLFALA